MHTISKRILPSTVPLNGPRWEYDHKLCVYIRYEEQCMIISTQTMETERVSESLDMNFTYMFSV